MSIQNRIINNRGVDNIDNVIYNNRIFNKSNKSES